MAVNTIKVQKAFLISLIVLNSSCSNTNFRTQTNQTTQPKETNADAIPDTNIQTAPIGSAEGNLAGIVNKRPDSLFVSIPAAVSRDANYKFSLDLKSISTDFKLIDKTSPKVDAFTQENRAPRTQTFTQGTPGQAVTDNFTQAGKKGLVDILVVIDNSPSMEEEQTNLSTKLNELLVSIKDVNWQIRVITTSPSFVNQAARFDLDPASEGKETCGMTLIKSTEADAATKFAVAVKAGVTGNAREQGIRQAVVGLRCTESPWLRPTASLAILIVSDEDNCSSDGADCGTLKWAKESYLTNYLESDLKRNIGKDTGIYGIFSPPAQACRTAGNVGTQYQRLVNYKANGAINYGNICDASYKTTLNHISDNIALLLSSQFELKSQPDPGTLNLVVQAPSGAQTAVPASSYTLAGKVITFLQGQEPANGSKIIANYIVGAKPLFNSVELSNDAAPGTLVVKINSTKLPETEYTLSGRTLSFRTQPTALANVMLDYRLNTPLFERFRLTQVPLPGTLTVEVNSVISNDFTYDEVNGEIVFSKIPPDAAQVTPKYSFRIGPELNYTLSLLAGGKNFKIYDGATEINFTQNSNIFTINLGDHKVGKNLRLQYEAPDNTTRSFDLGQTPIADSLKVESQVGTCTLGNGIEVTGDQLLVTCPVMNMSEFKLSYRYKAITRNFIVEGIAKPDSGTWAVYYDGELTTDYVRKGSSFTFNFDPDLDSSFDFRYTFPE
ncbi:MAG: hypothetical protein NTX25_19305 [Proteobacteria bacterium]|nr:hypothetical protein [Pseudomonadota bacterium]